MKKTIVASVLCLFIATSISAQSTLKIPKISTAINELISRLKLDVLQTGKLKDIFTSSYTEANQLKAKMVASTNDQKKKAYRDLITKTDEKVKGILKSTQLKEYTNWRTDWTSAFKKANPTASEIKQLENELFM